MSIKNSAPSEYFGLNYMWSNLNALTRHWMLSKKCFECRTHKHSLLFSFWQDSPVSEVLFCVCRTSATGKSKGSAKSTKSVVLQVRGVHDQVENTPPPPPSVPSLGLSDMEGLIRTTADKKAVTLKEG